jgi:hypothetical protein
VTIYEWSQYSYRNYCDPFESSKTAIRIQIEIVSPKTLEQHVPVGGSSFSEIIDWVITLFPLKRNDTLLLQTVKIAKPSIQMKTKYQNDMRILLRAVPPPDMLSWLKK